MILDYLNEINEKHFRPTDEKDLVSFSVLRQMFKPEFISPVPNKRPVYSSVDWLRCTTTKIGDYHDFVKKFLPLLSGHGFDYHDKGIGMLGYTHTWLIQFNGENCGHICVDDKDVMGGMFELTGMGCQLLQSRWDLWYLLNAGLCEYEFKIKRLDVCTDFRGRVWDKYNVNILDINRMINDGMFKPNHGSSPSVSLIGDWSQIVAEHIGSSSYDPKSQALGGLTVNVGSSSSVNRHVIYEKGKQLAGKNPDRYNDDSLRSWVRYERRFATGSGRSEVVIPFDFAINPDEALVYNSPVMSKFIGDWLSFQKSNDIDLEPVAVSGIDLERVGLMKSVRFRRTAVHVANQSKRFFRSLTALGINPHDFVDLVISDDTNKGFSVDLNKDFTLAGCFGFSDGVSYG